MTQRPLELPVPPVLGLDRGIRRWKKHRRVVAIIMAEKMAGPDILHVEPAGRKTDYWDHEFPAVVAPIGRKRLDGSPGAGLWMGAVDVQHFVIEEVDDVVARVADHG